MTESRWRQFFDQLKEPWRPTAEPPIDRRELGTHAKQLLDDPVLHYALDRVEDKLTQTWKTTDPADEEGRERVYATLQGLQRFRQELRLMIANAAEALRPNERE